MTSQQPLLPTPQELAEAPLPAATTDLSGADLARLRRSLDSSVSENTRVMYNSAWKSFETWAQSRGALSLPASLPLVAAYLAHLAEERRLSVATVRLHKAAIAAIHKVAGHADPTDNEGIRQILKSIARAHGKPQRQARPLTAEALAAVKATAGLKRPFGGRGKGLESAQRASLRARVDVALLATLRDGLLRRSEAAALTWGDVEFRDDGAAAGHPAPVQDGPRVRRRGALHRQGSSSGPEGHSARGGVAGPEHLGLRDDHPQHWQTGRRRREGGWPGRGVHRPQRPRGYGPGPGQERRGTSGAHDRRPLEVFKNAGALHRAAGRRPGGSGQVLPGKWCLKAKGGGQPWQKILWLNC